jgi:hypothetical protein
MRGDDILDIGGVELIEPVVQLIGRWR